jgi:hypothetical protein
VRKFENAGRIFVYKINSIVGLSKKFVASQKARFCESYREEKGEFSKNKSK